MQPVRCLSFALLATLVLACSSQPEEHTALEETRRSLPAGELIGSAGSSGAHQWLGIPYAQPPVGDLRWRAPQPLAAWPDTLQAVQHGDACLQPAGIKDTDEDVYGSEDCLTLDIYAPAMPASEAQAARLPVMFWIHGGGNSMGQASTYNSSELAVSQNVIVVAIQYRLGPLGWFYHQGLHGAGASAEDRSGNYGTLDTIAALQWVQNNIGGFGGDPGNVTVFGESAGGMNTFALLVAPKAKGLFHRAISQSGVAISASIETATRTEKNSSHGMAEKLLQTHKLASTEQLRTLDGADLIRAYMATPDDMMLEMPTIIADGSVLPGTDLLTALQQGQYHKVPTILGSNRDEFKLFMAQDPAYVDRYLGFWINRKDPERYDRDAYYGSTQWRVAGAEDPARAMDAAPVYVYRFDWDSTGKPLWMDLPGIFGAAHAFELPFLFPEIDLGPMRDMILSGDDEQGQQALSQAMMNYWGNFAHHGDPNQGKPTVAQWQRWGQQEQFLIFDAQVDGGIRSSKDTATIEGLITELAKDDRFSSPQERCELFDELSKWSMAIRPHRQQLACET